MPPLNTEFINLILWPLNRLAKIISVSFHILFYIAFVGVCFLINNVGWVVGIGTNGYLSRQWEIEKVLEPPSYEKPPVLFTEDFAYLNKEGLIERKPASADAKLEDCYWDDDNEEYNRGTTSIRNGLLISSNDSEFLSRSRTSWKRKKGRLMRALEVGYFTAYELRLTIKQLQEGGSDDEKIRMDSHSIILRHAPKVLIMRTDAKGVLAVCLANVALINCRPETTFYADLFTTPLPANQEEAERALLAMGTADFWLTAAHENGVYGHDAEIRKAQSDMLAELDDIFEDFSKGGPDYSEPVGIPNYLGLQ